MPRPEWLHPPDPAGAFATAERCTIEELWNDAGSPATSLARARVAPGVTTQLHALQGVSEVYVIEAGTGLVEVAGATAPVGPGDRVAIPAGAAQRITNTGAGDLVFLCLCTPRFTPDCYVDLEGPARAAGD